MTAQLPLSSLDDVAACVAEVLGLPESTVDRDVRLSELGLESFTAVRLRRRIREELALDLPLTAFLGAATIRTVAQGSQVPVQDESFPLTPIQTAYLVGREPVFPLGGVATFFYYEYDRVPTGDPVADLAVLEGAWNRVVRRHHMLRMVIGADARQRVLAEVPEYRFERIDLRGRGDVDGELSELRQRCSHQLRPVDRWPLFDIRAALLPDGRTRLFVGIDVLTVDLGGWFQLMREWGALVADPTRELPELVTTFADYLRLRAEDPEEQARRAADSAYWASRDLPPGPALPWSRAAAELGLPRFCRYETELDEAEWAALRKRAATHGLTPTGVLLAAFGLVLDRWGATAPFSLNTTLFGRAGTALADRLPGLEHVVGDFTSTLLVEMPQTNMATWLGFADYAAAVNKRFWTDMDHRSVSGVEMGRGTGKPDAAPPHPVVFTSGVGLAGDGEAPTAWLGQDVFGVSQTPQVLLDHIVFDEVGRLRIAWDTVDGALPVPFVEGMCDAHVRLLRTLAANESEWNNRALGWDPSFLPDLPLASTPFGAAGPLLDDPARTAARTQADAPALMASDRKITHGDLAGRAETTAGTLAALGIGPGDLVAVVAEKGAAQVAALLGVNRSGAGYVPVEPDWPAARVASLCAQAGVRHALLAPGITTEFPEDVSVHRLSAEGVLSGPAARPRPATPDDLAYAIFTSGSTGKPKGVAIEHRAVRTTLDDLASRFQIGPRDRVLALSAVSFDLSVFDIYAVLGVGGGLVLPDHDRQRDPGHWLELMARHEVTVWNSAPALLEMLAEYAEVDRDLARDALRSLRLVLLSGDWIPVTLPDRIRALAPSADVVSLGGATEGSIWSICYPIGAIDATWPSIPYGRALLGQSFHIISDDGLPCPVGVPGELYIGGDGLAREYIGDPEQTTRRFIHHYILDRRLYRTGDLGRWRPDGTIEFLGRADRQVKIRGHRIELGEVESVLDRAPGVRKSVAKSVPGPDERPRLVAFIAPSDPDAPPAEDDLIAVLRASVPEFMVPSRFVHLPEFPVTANGKIDYAALANPYRRPAAPAPIEPHVEPAVIPASDWLGSLIASARKRGLGVAVTLTPGGLAPVDALMAAATWANEVRDQAAAAGMRVAERLPATGLLEIELGEVAEPPRPRAEPVHAGPVNTVDRPDSPDPEVERAVAAVFADLVNAPVDPQTSFFQLGATSLTLVLAYRRLAADLAPDLTVVDVFGHPTVRDLALLITRRRAGSVAPSPEPAPPPVEPVAENSRAARRRAARALAGEVTR